MPKQLAYTGLPPRAYWDMAFFEQEKEHLFRTHWQWAGFTDNLNDPGGVKTEIAGLPISVHGDPSAMRVVLDAGRHSNPLDDAVAEACGRFVFVRLTSKGPSLAEFLGDYTKLLKHCSENFDEAYHVDTQDWQCNWKSGLEITLEGYHVPYVHAPKDEYEDEEVMINGKKVKRRVKKKKINSNLSMALPRSLPPTYDGPHSYLGGEMSDQMRDEMDNIAKRLKIKQSEIYKNYDHFTLFPNMTVGFSGGDLCFIQIYTPAGPGRTHLKFAYILAKLADPAVKPVPIIKSTLLNKWRDYTIQVLKEDQDACEMFQRGVPFAENPARIARKAEERVAHFHNYWREAMRMNNKYDLNIVATEAQKEAARVVKENKRIEKLNAQIKEQLKIARLKLRKKNARLKLKKQMAAGGRK